MLRLSIKANHSARALLSSAVAALFAAVTLSSTASADLVVNTNLGNLGLGSTPISGTTVGGPNNASTYTGANPAATWFEEYVYQFTLSAPGSISLTSNDPNAGPSGPDNDFFLLNSLAVSGSPTTATGVIPSTTAGSTGFSGVEVSGGWGIQPAGTYYLSIDAFRGPASNPSTATAFSGQLTIGSGVVTPPPSIPASLGGSTSGLLGPAQVTWYSFNYSGSGALSFDTEGSSLTPSNDTELGLYNSIGNLIGTDDDDGTDLLSLLETGDEIPSNLPAGMYYLAVGGYNTTFNGTNFDVTSTSTNTGAYVLNGLSVPEPGSIALLGAGVGVSLMPQRRRSSRRST